MSRIRPWIFWAHLTSGVIAGLLILFFAITGSLLAYERPILAHADSHYVVAHSSAARLPIAELVHRAPFPVSAITLLNRPDAPVELTAGRRDLYMANPYTGDIMGLASPRLRSFFAQVTSLHRWFGLEDNHRTAASAVKAATDVVFLFLLLSGAMLWLPKVFTGSALRIRSRLVKRTSWRARAWNWHHVAGLWTGLPLLIIVLTGMVMAYPWANALLYRMAGTPVPPRPAAAQDAAAPHDHQGGGKHHGAHAGGDASPLDLDAAFAAIANAHSGWRTISLRLQPGGSKDGLAFTVDNGDGGHPAAKTQVIVAMNPGQQPVLHETPFAAQPRGQRWRTWVRFSHTGEAAGWLGETLALLSALGACVLALTGLQMFCHRLARKSAAP